MRELRVIGILSLIHWLASASQGAREASCSADCDKETTQTPVRRLLSSLRRIGGSVRSDLTFTRSPGNATAVHASRDIASGEILFRIPRAALLWPGAKIVKQLAAEFQAFQLRGHLTEAECLVLSVAAIKKGIQKPPESSPIRAYVDFLKNEPLPNATVLWRTEVLAWLSGTEAGELTQHFLRRIAQIHAVAPLLLECTWLALLSSSPLMFFCCESCHTDRHDDIKAPGFGTFRKMLAAIAS